MTEEQVEYYMKLMPSGTPIDNATWNKLSSWIQKNENKAKMWKTYLLSIDEEDEIYKEFGCKSQMVFERELDIFYSMPSGFAV
jgi:hypothetical protein